MNILNKPVRNITFEDVVSFCKEYYPEGVQIDYKKEFPSNDLAKHFAAFSNKRGGVIIIGVEEDRKSGVPIAWDGVIKDAKRIERIHQLAANVEPIPSYDVCATDEKEGKCFVLIRIYEGDKTPYYVQNDSNVWVRTGNVRRSIGIASPDGLELLFGKKEKAEKTRNLYSKVAEENYIAGLEREEKKRKGEVERAKKQGKEDSYYLKELGKDVVICRIFVQPYFPSSAIAHPREIKAKLQDLRVRAKEEFPGLNMSAIPEGLFYFEHYNNGYYECQQIFSKGLVFSANDVSQVDDNGTKTVPLARIACRIAVILRFTKNLYDSFGYWGVIDGEVSIDGMKNVYTRMITPSGYTHFDSDKRQSFLSYYKWGIQTDTSILSDSALAREWFISFVREMYWSFGYENISDEVIDKFLTEHGLIF